MPLVTMTLHAGRSAATRDRMLDAVHAALVSAGVPPTDRFQRVIELSPGMFRYDARYPDADPPRDERFVLVEILWSVGRNVKVKRSVAATIAKDVAAAGEIHADDVMVVFVETAWENWAFAGGRLLNA